METANESDINIHKLGGIDVGAMLHSVAVSTCEPVSVSDAWVTDSRAQPPLCNAIILP